MSVLAPLLDSLVDYAGLFPPAKLAMPDAVRNHAAYLAGPHRALLGRFILPLARLPEFEEAHARLHASERDDWRLSVIAGPDPDADWAAINAFHARQSQVRIVSIESKAATAAEIQAIAGALPPVVETWIEMPAQSPGLPSLIAAVKHAGRGAKLRTGGVTADAFPSATHVVGFLRTCRDAGVTLKATAGLHHPLRGDYRLTYDPGSANGKMFGFLNVFLCATLLNCGGSDAEAVALLEESDPQAFSLGPDALTWRGRRFTASQFTDSRRHLCRSFGSCSFTEPIEGLQELSWL